MRKQKNSKHRLRSDPDGMLGWMDGGHLPHVSYESAEITGIKLSILDNCSILTAAEKNRLWKLVLQKATVYRAPEGELSVNIYPNLPK